MEGLKLTLLCSMEQDESCGHLRRASDELKQKMTENSRNDISVGAKIFINKPCKENSAHIEKAIDSLLQVLNVDYVDNVVLAHHPQVEPTKSHYECLKTLWLKLEEYAAEKKILQLGMADLDKERLEDLFSKSKVKPTIAQINLAKCCVVPNDLKDFCTANDIQLLTHSDSEVLLTDEQFGLPEYVVDWIIRYQVHVRCRGVLTAKGYILGASKKP